MLQAGSSSLSSDFPHYIPVIVAVFWVLLSYALSFVGGWFALSRHFRAQSEPYGEVRTAGSFFNVLEGVGMRFGVSYSNLVRLAAAEDALYLSVFFLLRLGHPPLCIPWKEIKDVERKSLGLRYVVLLLGEKERIPLYISERMASKLGILERLLCSQQA
jgi:hypothetical protein